MKPLRILALVTLYACTKTTEPIGPDPSGNGSADATSAATGTGTTATGTSTGTSTGSGPNTQAGYISGTRLRARYLQGDDGSKEFIGWFDKKLNQPCVFRPTSAGERCLPVATVIKENGTVGSLFSDNKCTVPAAQLVPCSSGGDVVSVAPATACGGKYEAYHVTSGQAYTKSCTNCACTPAQSAYLLGSPAPATDFVSASEMTE